MAKNKRRSKTTVQEKTRARQTGASVEKLRAEQKAAESLESLAKARARYAEAGHPQTCGDWMAEALKVFRTADGDFDLEGLTRCLKENDIQPLKVDMERPGAIGRFRMCAGLMLRRQASKVGHVVIGGKKLTAPGVKKRGRKATKKIAFER